MSINYPIFQVGGGGVTAAEVSGAVTGGLDPVYSGSITLSGTKTLSGSLLVSGSEFSILGTTRSDITVVDDKLDIVVTGSNGGGTQILLDAKNDAGDSLVIAQAGTYAAVQAGGGVYPYYVVADSTQKYIALEADDATATIYVGGTGYASAINVGSSGERVISVGNTGSATQVVISAGISGTVITGSLNISGTIQTNNTITLLAQSTLPVGSLGMLATSGSNLYFHDGSSWREVTLV